MKGRSADFRSRTVAPESSRASDRRARVRRALVTLVVLTTVVLPLAQVRPVAATTTPPQTGLASYFKFYQHTLWDRANLRVNVASGNLVLQMSDYHILGVNGHNLTLNRYYNSLAAGTQTGSGYGWNLSFGKDVALTFGTGQITLHDPTGYQAVFTGSNPYTAPPGLDATLTSGSTSPCATSYQVNYHKSHDNLCFNASGVLQKDVDQHGNTISYAYNTDGTLHRTTDTRGRTITLSYFNNQLIHVYDDTSPTRGEGLNYDNSGNMYVFNDVENGGTNLSYDGSHNLIDIRNPSNTGEETTIQYDSLHRVTAVSYLYNFNTGAVYTAHFAYNSGAGPCTASGVTGNTALTDENSHQSTECWDATGKVLQVIDPKGHSQSATYDTNFNVTGYVDQSNNSSSAQYSGPAGGAYSENLTSIQQPSEGTTAGATTTAQYQDSAPLDQYSPTSVTSSQGSAFTSSYDGQGDQSSQANSQPANNTVKAYYNGNGTLIGLLDAKGTQACTPTSNNPTQPVPTKLTECYAYDSLSQLTSITYPAPLGTRSFTYDSRSRLNIATDGKGQTAMHGYDAFDRLKEIDYSDHSAVSFYYDMIGNMTQYSDATGGTNLSFDLLNRLIQKTPTQGAITSFAYDGVGNITQLTDDLGTVTYGYDSTNFLGSVTDQSSQVTRYTPDARGNRVTSALANGTTVSQTFDNSSRVTEIKVTSSNSTVLQDLTYSYLKAGATDTNLRYSVTDHVSGASTAYTYDSLDRLVEAKTTGGTGSDYKYSYDANSNLCRTDGAVCSPSTDSYGYNAANELTSLSGVAYGYDANGSLTSIGTAQTFTYNAQAQMITSTLNGTPTSYVYSGIGQTDRFKAGATTFTSTKLGIDNQVDATGTTHYVRDSGGNLLEEILPSGTHEYYVFDALGSVRGLTNGGASLVNSYTYDPYGTVTAATGATVNPWKYISAYNDTTTALYHMGARYYAASSERWASIDPVNNPNDTHGWNRYFYSGDDPVNYTDPSGATTTCAGGTYGPLGVGTAGVCSPAPGTWYPYIGAGLGEEYAANIATTASQSEGWSWNVQGCVIVCGGFNSSTGGNVSCCGIGGSFYWTYSWKW